jgi:hypothetical protein
VLEVQLGIDRLKRFTWPAYATHLRAERKCPTALVVVAPDAAVATWAGRAIHLGGGNEFTPMVVGLQVIPIIKNRDTAARLPELAVLSALAHGQGEHGTDVGRAAFEGLETLASDQKALYSAIIFTALNAAAKAVLRNAMSSARYDIFSFPPFVEQMQTFRSEAKAEGKAEGKAEAILAVLNSRSVEITEAGRAQILSCRDLAQLDLWLTQSTRAARLEDLLSASPAL